MLIFDILRDQFTNQVTIALSSATEHQQRNITHLCRYAPSKRPISKTDCAHPHPRIDLPGGMGLHVVVCHARYQEDAVAKFIVDLCSHFQVVRGLIFRGQKEQVEDGEDKNHIREGLLHPHIPLISCAQPSPLSQVPNLSLTRVVHYGRVVKALDSKSDGFYPRELESH